MYDFNSALFWYKFIFMTELVATEGSFFFLLKERSHFWLRFAGAIVLLYVFTFAMPLLGDNAFATSTLFAILFFASLLALAFCFDEKWGAILFCGLWAYTVQHFSYLIGNFIMTASSLSGTSFYEGTISAYTVASILIAAASFVAVYVLSIVIMRVIFRRIDRLNPNLPVLIVLSGISLAIEVVINAFIVYLRVESISMPLFTLCYLYDFIGCFLTVALLIFSLWNKSLKRDNRLMLLLLEKERKSYEENKERIERINIMCHDLKHRLREFGESGYTEERLKKLESAISAYDLAYRTGNDVLDVILNETVARCSARGIQFVCIADGKALAGMEAEHVYSLFDNALHNALDAVSEVREDAKRYILLQIAQKDRMVSVHVENYFGEDKKLVFKDGVPQTTKDGEWHGFGMKSIRRVVELYDGGMSVDVKGRLFSLNLFFRFPANEETMQNRR